MKKVLISGRGGSGKSTIAALLAKRLSREGNVLVVDSDESNMGLPVLLGIKRPPKTLIEALGGKDRIREKLRQTFKGQEVSFFDEGLGLKDIPPQALAGGDGLWFLSIGKEEHAMEGCACPMGLLGRDLLEKIDDRDTWILVDTEAGVEHFGRGLVSAIDVVLYVAEPALESLLLLEKAKRMTEEARKPFLVLANKVQGSTRERFMAMLKQRDVEPVAVIPFLDSINMADLMGTPLDHLPGEIEDVVKALRV